MLCCCNAKKKNSQSSFWWALASRHVTFHLSRKRRDGIKDIWRIVWPGIHCSSSRRVRRAGEEAGKQAGMANWPHKVRPLLPLFLFLLRSPHYEGRNEHVLRANYVRPRVHIEKKITFSRPVLLGSIWISNEAFVANTAGRKFSTLCARSVRPLSLSQCGISKAKAHFAWCQQVKRNGIRFQSLLNDITAVAITKKRAGKAFLAKAIAPLCIAFAQWLILPSSPSSHSPPFLSVPPSEFSFTISSHLFTLPVTAVATLLGRKIPAGLRVLLLVGQIADQIGSVVLAGWLSGEHFVIDVIRFGRGGMARRWWRMWIGVKRLGRLRAGQQKITTRLTHPRLAMMTTGRRGRWMGRAGMIHFLAARWRRTVRLGPSGQRLCRHRLVRRGRQRLLRLRRAFVVLASVATFRRLHNWSGRSGRRMDVVAPRLAAETPAEWLSHSARILLLYSKIENSQNYL